MQHIQIRLSNIDFNAILNEGSIIDIQRTQGSNKVTQQELKYHPLLELWPV